MLSLIELYSIWFTFWLTYFCFGCLFPQDKTKTRTPVTYDDVTRCLIYNCLVTTIPIPILSYIPHIFPDISIVKYMLFPLLTEIWFYYSHRIMHTKYFYKWHKDHHNFIISYGLAGLYCSPTEMIFVNQLSVAIPFQLLGFSFKELVIINILVALNILKSHAAFGYRDNSPLYLKEISLHDIHHSRLNCNYGIFCILDRLHDTFQDKSRVR